MQLAQNLYDQIVKQAKEGLPYEICGMLAGKDGEVTQVFEMTNIDESHEHFTLDPAEQFKVIKEARKAGLDLMAVYHSHPETPARPSEEDIKLAFDPKLSYVILSLAADEPDIKSFIIKDGEVTKETLEIT